LPSPAPKKVAIAQAQTVRVLGGAAGAVAELFVVTIALPTHLTEIFEHLGIEDGGADFVDTHSPLAEVDFAAAIAAKGEVFVFGGDDHAARGAVQELCGFFLWRHVFVEIPGFPPLRQKAYRKNGAPACIQRRSGSLLS
jgi:hypothetical protein